MKRNEYREELANLGSGNEYVETRGKATMTTYVSESGKAQIRYLGDLMAQYGPAALESLPEDAKCEHGYPLREMEFTINDYALDFETKTWHGGEPLFMVNGFHDVPDTFCLAANWTPSGGWDFLTDTAPEAR